MNCAKSAASYAVAICVLAIAAPAFAQTAAQTAADTAVAQAKVWAKEQSIYVGRASGGLGAYLDNAAPNYLAWPPFTEAPYGKAGLSATRPRVAGAKERITTELKGFTLQGDTAIIYYTNHRTAMGDGTPVDQYYENIHVWVRMGDDWKVLGGMSRAKPLKDK